MQDYQKSYKMEVEKMRQKCFFTYCWDDPDFVVDVLDYMDRRIEKESNYNIKVTIDRKALHTADNFKEFEKQIKDSDSVVVFFSPNYKRIIESNETTRGVYREYQFLTEEYKK